MFSKCVWIEWNLDKASWSNCPLPIGNKLRWKLRSKGQAIFAEVILRWQIKIRWATVTHVCPISDYRGWTGDMSVRAVSRASLLPHAVVKSCLNEKDTQTTWLWHAASKFSLAGPMTNVGLHHEDLPLWSLLGIDTLVASRSQCIHCIMLLSVCHPWRMIWYLAF